MSKPTTPSSRQIVDAVVRVLAKDGRVNFAYLYGSMVSEGAGKDIDLAVFAENQADSYSLAVDQKIDLDKATGISPDLFDVRLINDLIEKGDLFASSI